MLRYTIVLLVAAMVGCSTPPAATTGHQDPPRKLRAVLWIGGFAHDFEAAAEILTQALPQRIPIDIKVVRDGSFLDTPEARHLDVILMHHCYKSAEGVLTAKQKQTLLNLVRAGVGVVAIHASYYSFVDWDAYHELFGARFIKHGKSDVALVVRAVDKTHPIMKGLADAFEVRSELYQSTPLPADCHLLARAREKGTTQAHPSVWTRQYGKGRVVTILPAHWPDAYRVADFQKLIATGTRWAARHP